MYGRKKVFSFLLVSGVFALAQIAPLTAANGAEVESVVRSGSAGPADAWTAERMRNARAIFWNEESIDGSGFIESAPADRGPPGSSASGAPRRPALIRDGLRGDRDLDSDGGDAQTFDQGTAAATADEFATNFGTADVFDSDFADKIEALQTLYPLRTIGKLFFSTPGGDSYCSASVISGNNNIVTAGHCCHGGPGSTFYSDWSFAPAHRDTNQPFGTFPWSAATILTEWRDSGTRRSDVCVLTMAANSSGQALSATVGWLGRSWNFGATQHKFAYGYPSNINSNRRYYCAAETFGASSACGGAEILNMGCDMTFGSSGGPWIRTFKMLQAGAVNFVNAVVSGWDSTTCTGSFGLTFNGPRFTSNNIVPLCTARGC